MQPINSLDQVIEYFKTIGTVEAPTSIVSSILNSATSLFKTSVWTPPENFETELTANISYLMQAASRNDQIEKTIEAIDELQKARFRLQSQPLHKTIYSGILPLIDEAIDVTHDFNTQNIEPFDDMCDLYLNSEYAYIMEQIETILKGTPHSQLELLYTFLRKEGGREIYQGFFEKFNLYRQANLDRLSRGDFNFNQEDLEFLPVICFNLTERFGDESNDIMELTKDLVGLAVPTNTQINTDGFTVGLFNPNLPSRETLSLPNSAQQRFIDKHRDALGFSKRGWFINERALWLNVQPRDVATDHKPFVSGDRQICFKLPDGSRREARAKLDLSPLGDITVVECREILGFIRKVCDTYGDQEFYRLFQQHQDEPLKPENLKPELSNILKKITPLADRKKMLIDIAIRFNRDLTIEMYKALFSLTPDHRSSCIDQLRYAFGEHWEEKRGIFQQYWESVEDSVVETKRILDIYDGIQNMLCTVPRNPDAIQASIVRYEEAVNSALEKVEDANLSGQLRRAFTQLKRTLK